MALERLLAGLGSAVALPTATRLTKSLLVVPGISRTMIDTVAPEFIFPSRQMISLPMSHLPVDG